jgi:hypothetical protein
MNVYNNAKNSEFRHASESIGDYVGQRVYFSWELYSIEIVLEILLHPCSSLIDQAATRVQ